MSERERWVVYPLLFLALGVSLRDKLLGTVARSIRCQELTIVDGDSPDEQSERVLARIGPVEPKAGGPALGGMWIDGDLQIVEEVPNGKGLTRTLIELGRTEPMAAGLSAGLVEVNGVVNVNGLVNARHYASLPFMRNSRVAPRVAPPVAPGGQPVPPNKAPATPPKASPPADGNDSNGQPVTSEDKPTADESPQN
jgi:hypothetical protein